MDGKTEQTKPESPEPNERPDKAKPGKEPEEEPSMWTGKPGRREFMYGAIGFLTGLALYRTYDFFSDRGGTSGPPTGPSSSPSPSVGPESVVRLADAPSSSWIEPEVRRSVKSVLRTQLVIDYADLAIGGVPVRLRCYEGKMTGPTLRAKPGDTLYITLVNKLPSASDSPPVCHEPHVTNLHTHGLHVDPTDGDDVINNSVGPGMTKTLRYLIPKDHYPGTFWYHPHRHGAVALQVANGLAGALVIEGDIDELPEIAAANERIFVLQQIPYNDKNPKTVECDDLQSKFTRYTTINGELRPRLMMRPGEVERWRFIHAGIKEKLTIKLDGHRLNVIAHDGITTGHLASVETLELNPGYRADVLVKANPLKDPSKPETFNLYDLASQGLLEERETPQSLAEVVVMGEVMDMNLPDESALAKLFPLKDLSQEPIEQTVRMEFSAKGTKEFQICWPKSAMDCDKTKCFPFDNRTIPVKLNTVDEWVIATCNLFPSPPHHPFHIHVNPFQIMSINGVAPDPKKGQKVWGDTILVERGDKDKPPIPVVLRTKYARWTGETVLHCHILDHEDMGMMIKVNIQS